MTKSRSGFAALASLAALLAPLDYSEIIDLRVLRKYNLHVAKTFASEREELDALRTELQRELAEVRALTETDHPLRFPIQPAAELEWRRPLAAAARERKAKADEAAEKAKEEQKRDAQNQRLASLRQMTLDKHDLAKRMAAAHTTLTPDERKEQEALQKNWAEHNMLDAEPETDPIYSAPDDCGRKHLSTSAACACANVREREAERRAQATAPAPTTRPTSSSVHAPHPPQDVPHVTHPTPQGGHRPATPRPATPPTSSSPRPPGPPREQVVPERREQLVPGPGTRVSAPREQPVRGPPQRGVTPPAPPRRQDPPPPPTASSSTPATHLRLVPNVKHSPLAGEVARLVVE